MKKMEMITGQEINKKIHVSSLVTVHFLKNIKQGRLENFELRESMLVCTRLESLAWLIDPFKPSQNESMAYTSSPLVRPGAPPLSEDTSNTILLNPHHGSCKSIITPFK